MNWTNRVRFAVTGILMSMLLLLGHMSQQAGAQQGRPTAPPVEGPQITPAPGSPEATTTIDGRYIPAPTAPFGGQINVNAGGSKPYWPARIVPPKGAPNVLLIMTDDAGFGVPSTFGGVIPTPALDWIANSGLRYTMFHSTGLCSPTRAALITGRNHHSSGFGVISEMATGYPGYDSIIRPETTTIGRILRGDRHSHGRRSDVTRHLVPHHSGSRDSPAGR